MWDARPSRLAVRGRTDLLATLERRGRMRKAIATLMMFVLIGIAGLAAAATAGGDRRARPPSRAARLSLRVPPRWHVLHGWLSDVIDPAARLAVASFPASLSRHTCSCGFPNIISFPRDGSFIFVWEYVRPFSRRALARVSRRPARFHLAAGGGVRHPCDGSSDTFAFTDGGHVFQVEVYLGPRAGPVLRARQPPRSTASARRPALE